VRDPDPSSIALELDPLMFLGVVETLRVHDALPPSFRVESSEFRVKTESGTHGTAGIADVKNKAILTMQSARL
jgi:hypothetical protein